MRAILILAFLCVSLHAAEGVAISASGKTVTITVTLDGTEILDKHEEAKSRNLALIDAAMKQLQKAQQAVAYENAEAVDTEKARQIAEAEARAAKLKAEMPTSNVTDKRE